MTVIAFDGRYLAADKQVTWFNISKGTVTKIFKLEDSSYIGLSGGGLNAQKLLKWFRSEQKSDEYPKFDDNDSTSVFQVMPDGVVRLWGDGVFYTLEDKNFTTGSGQDYASAAMHLGCNAIKAVQITIELSPSCGMGIDVYDIETNTFYTLDERGK